MCLHRTNPGNPRAEVPRVAHIEKSIDGSEGYSRCSPGLRYDGFDLWPCLVLCHFNFHFDLGELIADGAARGRPELRKEMSGFIATEDEGQLVGGRRAVDRVGKSEEDGLAVGALDSERRSKRLQIVLTSRKCLSADHEFERDAHSDASRGLRAERRRQNHGEVSNREDTQNLPFHNELLSQLFCRARLEAARMSSCVSPRRFRW